jgi:DNA-binding response OmpR family regulator
MTPVSVLVVEDDLKVAMALRIRLEEAGHSVAHARTGATGVEAAVANPPDVMLLDIRLPDIDGFEVCSKIRGMPELAATRIVFLSAHSQTTFRDRATEVGGDLFLPKTSRAADVLQAIEALMSNQ